MIPTAEEFFKGISEHKDYLNIAKAFAKMHVTEALKQASENASLQIEEANSYIRYKSHSCKGRTFIIAKDSILTDCFLDNVV